MLVLVAVLDLVKSLEFTDDLQFAARSVNIVKTFYILCCTFLVMEILTNWLNMHKTFTGQI